MKTLTIACAYSLMLLSNVSAAECELKAGGPIIEAIPYESSRQLNCEYVQEVETLISNILKMSEDKVAVNLTVKAKFDGASFDGGLNIEVPEQLVFHNRYEQEFNTYFSSNLSVVAHEYGHALLHRKIDRELGPIFPVVIRYTESRQEISRAGLLTLKNPKSVAYAKKFKDLNDKILLDLEQTKFFIISAPYSELYADVIAIYTNNNKSAILNALYYDEMGKKDYKYIQTRDFSTEFNSTYHSFMTESHGYFAHTRTYIGKNLWPNNDVEKRLMLKKIGDAIIAEIKTILESGQDLPNYDEGNARLIKRLSEK